MSRAQQFMVPTRGGAGGAAVVIEYALVDEFVTDDPTPVVTPRTSEPGPGTLTFAASGAGFAVIGRYLDVLLIGGTGHNFVTESFAQVAGRAAAFRYTPRGSASIVRLGWDISSATNGSWIAVRQGFYYIENISGGFFAQDNLPEAAYISIMQSDHYLHMKLNDDGTAQLQWVTGTLSGSVTAGVRRHDANSQGVLDWLRMADLPAPYNADYGIVTQRLTGSQSVAATITHEANAIMEFVAGTLPSAGQIEVAFRKQDSSNFWRVTIDSSGNIDLDEVVSGTPTQRGTAAGVVLAGNRIAVVFEGENITVITGKTRRFSYASAANFKTATAGEIISLGTAGAVSDWISWPFNLSGTALSVLVNHFDLPQFESATVITADGEHNAFPSMEICDNGDLLVVYRKGSNHLGTDGVIVSKRSTNNGVTWDSEQTVLSNASFDYRYPGLGKLADGTLTLLVGQRLSSGTNITNGAIFLTSADNGATWSTPVEVTNTFTDFCRGGASVLELANGDLLAPLYGFDTGDTATTNRVRVSKSTDGGATWAHLSEPANGSADVKRYTEPGLVLLANGNVLCLVREDSLGDMLYTVSADSGATWSALTSANDDADAICAATKLSTGEIVIVQRNRAQPNNNARLLWSAANDETKWTYTYTFGISPNFTNNQMVYGDVIEDSSNRIHVIYGMENAATDEADILYTRERE